ncbi:MAG TPA: hypothetical protein ENI61_02300 [Ignavibacteria bacterium]|nr:hypothetical protein [Ignavibacteria bacterium]
MNKIIFIILILMNIKPASAISESTNFRVLWFLKSSFILNQKDNYANLFNYVLTSKDSINPKNPSSITASLIIDDYIRAIGGRKKLNEIKDRIIYLSGETRGLSVKMTIYQKIPNKLKQEVHIGSVIQNIYYDNGKEIMTAGGQQMEFKGSELEELKYESVLGLMLKLDSLGIKLQFKGTKKLNGINAYKVELIFPSGFKWIQYYDSKTGLKIREIKKVKTLQGIFNQVMEFEDYRNIKGVKYPFLIKQILGSQHLEFKVDSIKVNTGFNDDVFRIK